MYKFTKAEDNKNVYRPENIIDWAGTFGTRHILEAFLQKLNTFDIQFVSECNLKENEIILRYQTYTMERIGMWSLIKINPVKGLIYFLLPDNDGLPLFETNGIKLTYLILA